MNNCKSETAVEGKPRTKKMTKRYKTLQKKLKELEAELIYVFSLPGEKTLYLELLSEEIEQRFSFMKNLLSAEIASQPSKPHHLHHIAQRLTNFETAFREWGDHRRTASVVNNFDDKGSICSCDDSCRNDDGEACNYLPDMGSSPVYEVQESLSSPEGLVDVEVEQETGKKVETEADIIVKLKKGNIGNCGALIGGMIFGGLLMGAIMLQFSGCFHFTVHEAFLTPT